MSLLGQPPGKVKGIDGLKASVPEGKGISRNRAQGRGPGLGSYRLDLPHNGLVAAPAPGLSHCPVSGSEFTRGGSLMFACSNILSHLKGFLGTRLKGGISIYPPKSMMVAASPLHPGERVRQASPRRSRGEDCFLG
jgi:hypothetical protein